MSHFDKYTGPSAGFASQMRWRILARHGPNCMAPGLLEVSVAWLTDPVVSLGSAVELQMRRGFLLG